MSIRNPICSNCVYEIDSVDELELCATCRNAYDLGSWDSYYKTVALVKAFALDADVKLILLDKLKGEFL